MRSNYKRIGDFIKQVSLKNTEGEFDELLGINIDKFFMPSVANVIGTDLKRYKVVKKHQFACNRMHVGRDYRIPIALSRSETPFIVSPAYTVFEITDTSIIDPDYLMMWFSRPEFDREVWFHTDADVRGGLPWGMFCDIELPIPSIEKQRAIVKEYSTVVNRIKLNEELNQKLEETAQAIYKEWFVDFEFPITEESCPELASGSPHLIGKPYKSSGGEMVWNEELDKEVPEGWEVKSLSDIATYLNGAAMQKFASKSKTEYIPVLKIRELNLKKTDKNSDKASINVPDKYIIKNRDVIFSWSGTLTIDIWTGGLAALNQHLFKVSSDKYPKWLYYLSTKYFLNEFIRIADGNKTSLGHIKREHLDNSKVCIPSDMNKISKVIFESIIKMIENINMENYFLNEFQSILLSKMSEVN